MALYIRDAKKAIEAFRLRIEGAQVELLLFVCRGTELIELIAFMDVFGWDTHYNGGDIEVVADDYSALAIPGGFEDYGYYEDAFNEESLELVQTARGARGPQSNGTYRDRTEHHNIRWTVHGHGGGLRVPGDAADRGRRVQSEGDDGFLKTIPLELFPRIALQREGLKTTPPHTSWNNGRSETWSKT